MTIPVRIAVVVWMLALTALGLLPRQWPLRGPHLFGAGGHGVHAGVLLMTAVTVIAATTVQKPTWPGRR